MAQDVWTVGRALTWTQGYLQQKGDENPRVSAQWLLGFATGLSKMDLLLQAERVMEQAELDVLHTAVVRRAKGEPLQYISGSCPFRYIDVLVRPGALIPRPETEVLVSEALNLLPSYRATAYFTSQAQGYDDALQAQIADKVALLREEMGEISPEDEQELRARLLERMQGQGGQGDAPLPADYLVMDIGTGSGCIACSIASEHPQTHVLAGDISADALSLAWDNVANLDLLDRVELFQGDVGSGFPAECLGKVDLIVSNPPYIPSAVMEVLPREVAGFEPRLALDGGADGLEVFRRIVDYAKRALKPGGGLACELHETCLDAAAAIVTQAGFGQVRIVNDLCGKPRVLCARLLGW